MHKGIINKIGTYFSMFSHDDVGLIESSDLPLAVPTYWNEINAGMFFL